MPKSKTAFAEAFEKVGYQSAQQRLDAIADAAWAEHPRTMDFAREYVLREVETDAGLLWTMFKNWHRPAATFLLEASAARIRERRAAKYISGASSAEHTITTQPQRAGGRNAIGPSAADKAAAREHVAGVISKLDTYKVNGRPVGDVTPEEALSFRDAKARENRFIDLLTAGLPPHLPIRHFVRPEEAEAMWRRAQEEEGRNE